MKAIDFIPPRLQDRRLFQAVCHLIDYLEKKHRDELNSIKYKYQQVLTVDRLSSEYTIPEDKAQRVMYRNLFVRHLLIERGHGYYLDLFETDDELDVLLSYLPVLEYLKGHRLGVELLIQIALPGIPFTLTEWWERFGSLEDAYTNADRDPEQQGIPVCTFEIEGISLGQLTDAQTRKYRKLEKVLRHYTYAALVAQQDYDIHVEAGVGMNGQVKLIGLPNYEVSSKDPTFEALIPVAIAGNP